MTWWTGAGHVTMPKPVIDLMAEAAMALREEIVSEIRDADPDLLADPPLVGERLWPAGHPGAEREDAETVTTGRLHAGGRHHAGHCDREVRLRVGSQVQACLSQQRRSGASRWRRSTTWTRARRCYGPHACTMGSHRSHSPISSTTATTNQKPSSRRSTTSPSNPVVEKGVRRH